jgi:hypothetical protein
MTFENGVETVTTACRVVKIQRRRAFMADATNKKPRDAGLFSYLDLDDLRSSNSFRNSSFSSSFGFERGLGKGMTSDIGRTSLIKIRAECLSPSQLLHFCGEHLFPGSESVVANSN